MFDKLDTHTAHVKNVPNVGINGQGRIDYIYPKRLHLSNKFVKSLRTIKVPMS